MAENSRLVRVIVALTLFVVLVVSCSMLFLRVGRWYLTTKSSSGEQEAPVVTADSVHVYHSDYRKTSGFDPGTVRVFLRSSGNAEIHVKHVLIDDIPIPVWGLTNVLTRSVSVGTNANHDVLSPYEKAKANFGHKRIIWARLSPPAAGRNSIVQFICKLRAPLARPMRITMIMEQQSSPSSRSSKSCQKIRVETVIRPTSQHLAITAITFSENLDKAYCYVENRSEESCEISAVELDGVSIDANVWISSRKIAPQAKQVLIINRPKSFVQGAYHTFYVICNDGSTIAERVRAFSFFPIAAEWGAPPGFGLDTEPFLRDWKDIRRETNVLEQQSSPSSRSSKSCQKDKRSNYIFECAMHKFAANLTRSAQEILSRYDICQEIDPLHPSTIHMCRIRSEEGYGKFGETADILRINPFVPTGSSRDVTGGTPEQLAARLSRIARLGAAPSPVHSIVATHEWRSSAKLGSPSQLRRLVYSIIGEGVKGLFYRHNWTSPGSDAVNKEIRRINAELAVLRSWLAISDVAALSSTDSKEVSAYTLLCPEKGLIILLVNYGQASRKSLIVNTTIPDWLTRRALLRVEAGGLKHVQEMRGTGPLAIKLPVPESVDVYVLDCARK